MRGKIIYGRSTTLPNMRGHFHRPRINKLLDELLSRQLIVITAGAGYGKTHAVSAFLNNSPVRVIWLQLSGLANHVERFWGEFVYIMESQNKETSALLEQLGFPETLAKFDKFLHIMAKEIYSQDQVVLVFDDFHLLYDETILYFVKNLIEAKLENFSMIIISRTKLNFNFTTLFTNGLAGQIVTDDLRFIPDETAGYLKQYDILLSKRELEKVQHFTEGWPLALYLIRLSIKKRGIVLKDTVTEATLVIFEMIEKELFSEYTPMIQNFLVRVSLLTSFPSELIEELAGCQVADILELLDNNMFIHYNSYTKYYNFHHLFLDFLNRKHAYLTQQEIRETYLKAADWCAVHDLKLEALAYYDKCGRYDKILDIMLNFGTAIFSKTVANFYIGLIDKFPAELIKKNPILHMQYAGLLCNNAEVQRAIDVLLKTQQELEALPPTEANQTVLGELYCMLGLINLGMGNYDFMNQFKKASEYLPNGGMIDSTGKVINTKYAITLSKPAPGELKKMEEALYYAIPYASKVMHGYGYGLEYLASAEAAYFTGDMKKAAKNAYEAVYRARKKQISDVASSGYFLLMRIEAANGRYKGVVSNLEQMKAYVENLEDKWNFNGMPDVADGWFHIMTGHTEKVARWIIDDTIGENILAPYSMGMERLVKARYLLREGKHYELLAWLSQSEEQFRRYNNWLVLLDILIYKSIASHLIHDDAQMVTALREAYEISHGNDIIMPFVELGSDIRNVIYNVKRNGFNTVPDTWLNEISKKASTYDKHVRNMKSQHPQVSKAAPKQSTNLTKREMEMLGYLCQGLTNTDIASTCFITVSAVKKSLNNIYIKLGATNRADAVRIAIQKMIC